MRSALRQVTVNVADLDDAVASFSRAFGLTFDTVPDESTGGRLAATGTGVAITARPEAATSSAESSSVVSTWSGPLAAVVVAVDDLAGAVDRFGALGSTAVREYSATTGERTVAMTPLHGLPFHLVESADLERPAPSGPGLNRVVLAVDDIDRAAADLDALLGIKLTIFDIENMRFRVALGEDGIELIGKMDPVIEIESFWNAPIAGYVIRVDDLDETKQRMEAEHAVVSHEFVTPGGMIEVFYGNPGLHGVPITAIAAAEGGLLESMGLDESETSVNTTVTQP
jgi:predicted enzyme related to lactoylglutathione lyase